jgi:hypothetical protein
VLIHDTRADLLLKSVSDNPSMVMIVFNRCVPNLFGYAGLVYGLNELISDSHIIHGYIF